MQPKLSTEVSQSERELGDIGPLESANLPRHRWYFFKEAFSPNLVNYAMDDCGCERGDLVVDPFSGSGTVALTAALACRPALGIEVNPFLAFVARSKLSQCDPALVRQELPSLVAGIEKGAPSHLEQFSTFSEQEGRKKWLFNKEILRSFEGGKLAIDKMDREIRDIMLLCLISATMETCNAVKDGKCLRYKRDWQKFSFNKADLIGALTSRAQIVMDDLSKYPIKDASVSIITGDSRGMESHNFSERKFKLCITSPPYLNSFDYTDVYRPELFLGQFVKGMEGLRKLRLQTLRSHVQVAWPKPTQESLGAHFAESIKMIEQHADSLWNSRIPQMIRAYFEDITDVLRRLRKSAQEDASAWIVVSTSAYAGIEIPVDLIIADIGSKAGWFLREVSVLRHLRRVPVQQWDKLTQAAKEKTARNERAHDGPHLRESLIIFDARAK
jgi:hypothetical protein